MRLRLAMTALALAACRQKEAPSAPPPPPPAPAPQASPLRSDAACAAPLDAPLRLRAPSGELRIGVVAGLKDADEDNVAHLRKLVAQLVAKKADVLLADGDLGDNPDEQETLLGVLGDTALPVLAVSGNREVRSELDAAETELRKRGAKITDLSHARIVDLGDAVVVGLPGAFERRQVHAEGACVYTAKDVDALSNALDRLQSGPPVLLVAAVPPRGQDAKALDVSDGQNLGDPRLTPLLRKAAFGVFGQVWESGGRAVDAAGAPVPQKSDAERLYLNPGAADRTPWPMADGTTVAGQAALLTIHGRRASWERVQ